MHIHLIGGWVSDICEITCQWNRQIITIVKCLIRALPMYLKETRIFFSGSKEYFSIFLLIWPNLSKLYTRIVIFLTNHDAVTALPSCKVIAPRPCKKEGVDCCSTLDVEPRLKSVNLSSLFMSNALNPLTFRVSKVCPLLCEVNSGLELLSSVQRKTFGFGWPSVLTFHNWTDWAGYRSPSLLLQEWTIYSHPFSICQKKPLTSVSFTRTCSICLVLLD
jgi:hypothetical protein